MPRRILTIKMQNSTKLESWRLGTKCRHNADHLDQQHSSFNESTQLTLSISHCFAFYVPFLKSYLMMRKYMIYLHCLIGCLKHLNIIF